MNGSCIDVNECLNQDLCIRGERCQNTVGSYACVDIDECSGKKDKKLVLNTFLKSGGDKDKFSDLYKRKNTRVSE